MNTTQAITWGPSKLARKSSHGGAPLAFWGIGVDVLIGAVVIAGVALATLQLQLQLMRREN